MIAIVTMLLVGLNIISQFALIRKDHEPIFKSDYIVLFIQTIFIIVCVLIAGFTIKFLLKI